MPLENIGIFSGVRVAYTPLPRRRLALPMQARPLSIRRQRHMRGLTQEELAREIGYSVAYLNALERGKETGGMKVLYKLATFFGVPMDMIATFDDETEDVQETWQRQTG